VTNTPLSVAAVLLLLACTTRAAEEREPTDAEVRREGEADGSPTAAPTSGNHSSGRDFLIGAGVLVAAVVATMVGLSRKPKIKLMRRGSTVVERLDKLPTRPPETDDAGRGDVG
jgi:hypothetical protein